MRKKNPLWKASTVAKIVQGRIPGQLIIQMTNRCNAKCPQCGMRSTEGYTRSTLRPDEVKKMIDAAAEKGIQALSFTGGEPFLCFKELLDWIDYAGRAGIKYIRTGTNGFLFMNADSADYESRIERMAQALAQTKLRNLWISIDSADGNIHEAMRGLPGCIKGIEKALPIFHRYSIYPSANLGINRNTGGAAIEKEAAGTLDPDEFYDHYRQAFSKFYSFVTDLGFTMANACYPMCVADDTDGLRAVYGATSTDSVVSFSRQERVLLFQALMDTIPAFRSKIRIFSPRISLYALIRQYSGDNGYGYPCRGGIDFFFVDAQSGDTYPCGYRGDENLGKFWELDIDKIDKRAFCRQCDWECFRDPSELTGSMFDLRKNPFSFLRRFWEDKEYRKILANDIRYYRACDYFDGRKAPDYNKLAFWETAKKT